jgi:hypothetical protein
MCEASPFDTEEALLESLRGEFTGNDKTKTGGAYHKIIEGDYSYQDDLILAPGEKDSGDFLFTQEQAAAALQYKKDHPLMVHEMKASKIYHTTKFPIQVSGRVDGAEGLAVRDAKLKFRPFTVSDYLDSYQWRYYLDMLQTEVFYYDIFEVLGFPGLPTDFTGALLPPPYKIEAEIIAHPEIQCLAYRDMFYDITDLLELFLSYLENREIMHLLKPALPEMVFN